MKAATTVYVLRPFKGCIKSDIKGVFANIDDMFDYFGEDVTISDEFENIVGREALKSAIFDGGCDGAVIKVTADACSLAGGLIEIAGSEDYYYVSQERFF